MIDDRIVCTHCAELVTRRAQVVRDDGYPATARPGDCLAAIERRRTDVHDQYGPADVDLPRRCEHFQPQRDASDQRPGSERFPTLWREYQALVAKRDGLHRDAAKRGIERARAAIA